MDFAIGDRVRRVYGLTGDVGREGRITFISADKLGLGGDVLVIAEDDAGEPWTAYTRQVEVMR